METVKPDRKLQGKINFVTWRRNFEHAAKASDVLGFLTGEESVPDKPKKVKYLKKKAVAQRVGKPTTTATTPTTPTTPTSTSASDTSLNEGIQALNASTIDNNNLLRYQVVWNEWKHAKDAIKAASKLLDAWITDAVRIEIEDCANAMEAYAFINHRYKIPKKTARDSLVLQFESLKLDDFDDVIEYLNMLQQIRADLKAVNYTTCDRGFASRFVDSLPDATYRTFKVMYHFAITDDPDASPDLHYLISTLQLEEKHPAIEAVRPKN